MLPRFFSFLVIIGIALLQPASPVDALGAEQTLFSALDTPSTSAAEDPHPVELGVKFRAATAGKAVGIRFYKGPLNTGEHTGHLWSASGDLLAQAIFANETASGWQEARFSAPIALDGNATYVVSYFAPHGYYSADGGFFSDEHASGSLVAPSSESSGGNGLYRYSEAPAFPDQTFNATNYWVDLIFQDGTVLAASLTASPATIVEGDNAVLTWSASAADRRAGLNFATGNANAGATTVAPATTTTYTFSCVSCSGTTSALAKSATVAVRAADTSAPTVPTALRAVPVSTSENIVHWRAADDDTDVAGYNVYRNGKKIAFTNFVTYYNDKGLDANTTYTYAVSAADAAGNTSSQSGRVSATTFADGSDVRVGDPARPAALEQEIADAYKTGASSVTINPGTYVLPANEGMATFSLVGMSNFVINGYGAVISAVQTEKNVFGVFYGDNLVIRGITIQYNSPQTAQGRIVDKVASGNQYYLDVQLEAGYRQNPTGIGGVNTANFSSVGFVFDHMTKLWKQGVYDRLSSNVLDLGGGKWRLYYDGAPPEDVVEGDLMAFRGLGQNLLHPWVVFDSIFQDLTLRQGGTFGVKEDRSGRNHYFGLRITYGPKPAGALNSPLLSQSVDGFRSMQAQGGPDLQDSLIEGTGDDAVGVMGFYRPVIATSGRTLTVSADTSSGSNESTYPSFEVGDPARVTGASGFIDQATVTAVRLAGNNVELTLDKEIAAEAGYLVSNPNHNGSNYQLIHNTILNNRARGMILRGDNGKVLNNTIDGSTIHAVLFTAPELFFGGEAGYAWNVLVSNNTIRNTGFSTNSGDVGGIAISSGFALRGHRNIDIRSNVFENVSGVNLYVSAAEDVAIAGNVFLRPHHRKVTGSEYGVDPGALIWLTESKDITITGNRVVEPGPYETVLYVRTATTDAVTSDW